MPGPSSLLKDKRFQNALKLLVSGGLLALILSRIGLSALWQEVRAAHWGYLTAAFLVYLTTQAVRGYRWQLLLRGHGVSVPVLRLTYLYFVGSFFNVLLPTGFGGDAVRVLELAPYTPRVAEAIGTVLVDRLTGVIALLGIALLVLPFSYGLVPLSTAALIAVLAVGSVLGAWLLFFRQSWMETLLRMLPALVRRPLEKLYTAVAGCGERAVLGALAVSVFFNLQNIATIYLIALALDVHLAVGYFFLFVPLISLSLTLPISLAGLGVREGVYVVLFGQAGVAEPRAVAMSLLYYGVNVVIGIIGGVWYGLVALQQSFLRKHGKGV